MVNERQVKIAPSILAADFSRLGEEVCRVVEAGADLLHLDVMDGHFVPNLTMGPQLIKSIRPYTNRPFDVHLMLTHPHRYIDAFVEAGADLITVHIEACGDLPSIIDQVKASGAKVGIALCPDTAIATIEPYLDKIDLVLPMSVEPGFGGQPFIMSTLEKIEGLHQRIQTEQVPVEIEVDGGINKETAAMAIARGATILVAGTAIFGASDPYRAINALRQATPD